MQRKRTVLAKTKARSRITNGSAILPGVDGRSLWMRRFRDLLVLHTNDLGGDAVISEGERALVRRAATLIIALEQLEYRFAQNDGEASPTALDQYQRLSNTLRRLLESLGLKRRQRDVTPTLREYLHGEAAE